MNKDFLKKIKNALAEKLKFYNYKYVQKDKLFIGVHDDFVFRISFDTTSYGRLEIILEYDCPLLNDKLVVFPKCDHFMKYGFTATNKNWIIDKDKEILMNEYLKEIYFIIQNYFFILSSKIINNFHLEYYIQDKYDELFSDYLDSIGEEDPAWIYSMNFLESGKNQEEWTEEDTKKSEVMTKKKQDEEFPYEKIKKQILQTIEINKTKFKIMIDEIFGENPQKLKIDFEVFPTSLGEIFNYGKINETINKYGFTRKYDVNTNGRFNYGETYYFQKDKVELLVILTHELFLEFIIINEDKVTRINVYDGLYFWFGWLVGKEKTREYNINEALNKLESTLKSIR